MLEGYEKQQRAIHRDIAQLVYYYNGGIPITDAYNMSFDQINIFSKTVSDHFEKQNEAYKKAKMK